MPNLAAAQAGPGPQSSSSTVTQSSSTQVLVAKAAAAPALSMSNRMLQVNFAGRARIDVFNLTGSVVKTLWNGHLDDNRAFGLQGIPDGAYVVRVQTANSTVMRKIHLQ